MALVVLLAFVVLLTGLVLAYFTRSLASRKQSDSSLNDSRSRQLAQSALEVIVADLKQEIFNGSTTNTFGTETIYTPTNNFNAVPMRSGNPAYATNAADPVPNLTRRSVASDAIAFPGVSSRASAVSSTDPSLNGRFISRARWNKHYLIPRSDMGTNVDTTPNAAANFTPPDWVYVSSNGPEVLTAPSTAVIGRYAYAIYDEGGLLDMNVAGYVSNTPANAPHPAPAPSNLPTWGYANKGSLAFANLTVLPVTPALTQAQVDQIVGWRNYATARPAGNLGGLTFDATAALRYHDFVFSNTNGFLTVSGTATGGNTDQAFTSRQSLLQMRETLGFSQDALQYMGTFSRDLDQPSVSPSKDLPKIKAASTSNAGTWGYGNDAFNTERYAAAAKSPYDINPPFLSVRVTNSFKRADGTAAPVGEPLLKNRFPLSRLGLILRTATASKSDTDPIYRNFGLYRNSASDPWNYDHGDSTGILRLSHPGSGGIHQGVAQEGREPDFFELLKAAINVGSLAKAGGTNSSSQQYVIDQRNLDVLSALDVLRIGANIIDQFDADGYPTRIMFSGDSSKVVCGVEDLPYIYHLRDRPAFVSDSIGRYLIQPVLWNPHDPVSGTTVDAPSEFRIRAERVDAGEKTIPKLTYADGQVLRPDADWDGPRSYNPLTYKAGKSSGYYDFRQPTLVGDADHPATAYAAGNNFQQQWVDPTVTLAGVVAFDFLLKIPSLADPTKFTWLADMYPGEDGLPGGHSPSGVRFINECNESGNWIEFDSFVYYEETASHHFGFGLTSSPLVTTDIAARTRLQSRTGDTATLRSIDIGNSTDPLTTTTGTRWWGVTRTDPRTTRWSTFTWQLANECAIISRDDYIYDTMRGGTDPSFGVHHRRPNDNGFTGAGENHWGANSFRGYQSGYWADNTVRPRPPVAQPLNDEPRRFNRDPDGIPRRAMAGYSTDPTPGGGDTQLHGLPLVRNNFASRPLILNRPFRAVAELGYVYKGTPWKNLNFSYPESGDAALLDVFCIEEPATTNGLVAGRLNLNTRQPPVLQAVFSGASMDAASPANGISVDAAGQLGKALVARTTNTNAAIRKTPVASRADIVGSWNPINAALLASDPDPDHYFSGFASDIGTIDAWFGQPEAFITRKREAAIRALSAVGTTRTWNLMIDVIAQSGRFGPNAASMAQFTVEGEKRFWLHVAIDRMTGQILDQYLETVTE